MGQEQKQKRVKAAIEEAARKLEAEGVQYFIGVIDYDAPDGGKAYVQSDLKGEAFTHILDMALPTKQDVVNLGIWVGHLINARKKDK